MKSTLLKPALACILAAACTSGVHAQTLLYQWNADNATGSGASLNIGPSYIDGSMTGGVFLQGNANNSISTPASSGLSGTAGDLGVVQSANYNAPSSAMVAGVGNLSSLTGFTMGMWINLAANYTAGGTVNARLFDVNTAFNGDGNELYFAVNNNTNLQFGVNNAGNTGSVLTGALGNSIATLTNQWIFIGVSYSTAAGGTANLYIGGTNTTASLAGTLTGVGTISWSGSTNYIMLGNRNTGTPNRGLPGTIDDVSFYSGTGDQTFVDNIQAQVVPEPATFALAGIGGAALLIAIRRQRK